MPRTARIDRRSYAGGRALRRTTGRPSPVPAAAGIRGSGGVRSQRRRAGRAGRRQAIGVATKSLRCPALLRRALARGPAFRGLMAWAVPEAAFLSVQGFDDILVAYPSVQPAELQQAAELVKAGKRLCLTADSPAHLELASPGRPGRRHHPARLPGSGCLDRLPPAVFRHLLLAAAHRRAAGSAGARGAGSARAAAGRDPRLRRPARGCARRCRGRARPQRRGPRPEVRLRPAAAPVAPAGGGRACASWRPTCVSSTAAAPAAWRRPAPMPA